MPWPRHQVTLSLPLWSSGLLTVWASSTTVAREHSIWMYLRHLKASMRRADSPFPCLLLLPHPLLLFLFPPALGDQCHLSPPYPGLTWLSEPWCFLSKPALQATSLVHPPLPHPWSVPLVPFSPTVMWQPPPWFLSPSHHLPPCCRSDGSRKQIRPCHSWFTVPWWLSKTFLIMYIFLSCFWMNRPCFCSVTFLTVSSMW